MDELDEPDDPEEPDEELDEPDVLGDVDEELEDDESPDPFADAPAGVFVCGLSFDSDPPPAESEELLEESEPAESAEDDPEPSAPLLPLERESLR